MVKLTVTFVLKLLEANITPVIKCLIFLPVTAVVINQTNTTELNKILKRVKGDTKICDS